MTISTAPAPLSYNGDGATTAFSITWKFFAKGDIVVTLRSSANVETTWTLDTEYTLSAAGVDAGGTLTATTAPVVGETLVIELEPANTQDSSLPAGGPFPSPVVEDGLDIAAQRDAKIEALFNRALRVPKTDTQTAALLEIPIDSDRASKILGFDGNGKPVALAQNPTGSTDVSGNLVTSTGSTTARDLATRFNQPLFYAEDYGAVGDGVTDDVTKIQDAIDAAGTAGGGDVVLLAADYYIDSVGLTLTKTNVRLVGVGSTFMTNSTPFDQQYATRIKAGTNFPGSTPLLKITSTAGDAHTIHGNGAKGIQFECSDKAAVGIQMISTRGTRLTNVSVYNPTSIGIEMGVITATGWTGSNRATKHFIFDDIIVRVGDNTAAARGIVIDGAADGINVNFGIINQAYVLHKDGVGIDCYDCDSIEFGHIVTFTGSTGIGVVHNGTDTAGTGSSRDHLHRFLQCAQNAGGTGGLSFTAGTTQNAIQTVVLAYSRANGTPAATFETSARNMVHEANNNGEFTITNTNLPVIASYHTDNAAVGSPAMVLQADADNAAGTKTTFGNIRHRITDATNASEDSQWDFETIVAGNLARAAYVGQGLVVGAPTGGDLGAGTGDFENAARSDYGFRVGVFTAANIIDKTHTVNTDGNKVQGVIVWDSTNQRLMVANGSTDVSAWYVADGSATITPV